LAAHFAAYPARILEDAGPNAGKSLPRILIDSYEAGDQNWTPLFREEFKKRRGYDPVPWLPVLTKRLIGSPEITARVQWDWRKTIEELFAENYYGYMAELVHQHPGVQLEAEPYGGTFSTLRVGGLLDTPMSEFWEKPSQNGWETLRPVASSGHTWGKRIIAAESFTAWPVGVWEKDPNSLKATGDRAFCLGVNQIVLSSTAHQPWPDAKPGMTMGWWGTRFGSTQTWWEHGAPEWIKYLTRCQFLLQGGLFVGDIAYLEHGLMTPEPGPFIFRTGMSARPWSFPYGYNGDTFDEGVLLKRMRVEDGRVVLPDGMSYRLLVLPGPVMTPPVARRVRQLVREGATVIGPKPERSPSLQDYPACDREVARIGNEVWGDCDGKNVTERAFGKGRIFCGEPVEEVLEQAGIEPDFQLPDLNETGAIMWIHRRVGSADVYFVSNQTGSPLETPASFRVKGMLPELWRADTGKIEEAGVWWTKGGRTVLPLRLESSGSVFVVFRKAAGHADPVVSIKGKGATVAMRQGRLYVEADRTGLYELRTAGGKLRRVELRDVPDPVQVKGPWELRFPPNWGAPERVTLDSLISWPAHPDPGVKYFSGTATYVKEIEVPARMCERGRILYLDLGSVKNIAHVRVNGKDLGVLWKPPFRMEVTEAVKAGMNHVEIQVTNLWANRLIGDEQEPEDCEWGKEQVFGWVKPPLWAGRPLRKVPEWLVEGKARPSKGRYTFVTYDSFRKDSSLLESGLLGPVTLRALGRVSVNP
jgi:hypothetical protein